MQTDTTMIPEAYYTQNNTYNSRTKSNQKTVNMSNMFALKRIVREFE